MTLQKEEAENLMELASWQKQIIDERLNDYYKNPTNVEDFDKTMDAIEKVGSSINNSSFIVHHL